MSFHRSTSYGGEGDEYSDEDRDGRDGNDGGGGGGDGDGDGDGGMGAVAGDGDGDGDGLGGERQSFSLLKGTYTKIYTIVWRLFSNEIHRSSQNSSALFIFGDG